MARTFEEAWASKRAELVARYILRPQIVDLLEGQNGPDRTSRALALLDPHWRWLVLKTCPSLEIGSVVSVRDWGEALADHLGIPRNHTQFSRRRVDAAVAVRSFVSTMQGAGWVHCNGRDAREVLVLATVKSPPPPQMRLALKERRWALQADTLQLPGEASEDVLLSISPALSVLPPPLQLRRPPALVPGGTSP